MKPHSFSSQPQQPNAPVPGGPVPGGPVSGELDALKPVGFVEKVGYGLGDAASNLYWKTFEFFLLYFYTDVYGLPAAQVATMLLVTRIWDAVNDPIVGYLADRTRTRWGRFRPYLLWASLPLAVTGVLAFATPDFSPSAKLFYAYITHTMLMIAYTAINTPYGALLGVLSPVAESRTSLATYRFVAAFIGGIAVQWFTLDLVVLLGGSGGPRVGFPATMAFYGAVAVVLFWACFATTRERVWPAMERSGTPKQDLRFLLTSVTLHQITLISLLSALAFSFNWRGAQLAMAIGVYLVASVVSGLVSRSLSGVWPSASRASDEPSSLQQDFHDLLHNAPWMVLFVFGLSMLMHGFVKSAAIIYYFKYYCGRADLVPWLLVAGSVAAIAGMLSSGRLTARMSKRRALFAMSTIVGVSTATFTILPPDQIWVMFAAHLVGSFASGPIAVLLWSMYADSADYSEWRTGRRATGLIFSAATFSQKIGCSFGSALAAMLLGWLDYQAPMQGIDRVQPESVLWGLRFMVGVIPAGLALAAAATMWLYPINRQMMIQIERDLRSRLLIVS